MGFVDWLTGGKPHSWDSTQFDNFKTQFSNMVEGKFSWMDGIPPLNLPGAAGKATLLSIKGMVSLGERGSYALKTEKLHEHLQTMSLGSAKSYWVDTGIAAHGVLDNDSERVFVRLACLHYVVYGSIK